MFAYRSIDGGRTFMLASPSSSDARPVRSKGSLEFIMNAETASEQEEEDVRVASQRTNTSTSRPLFDIFQLPNGLVVVALASTWSPHTLLTTLCQPPSRTGGRRHRRRQCTVDGCTNFIINRGLCFRHGVSCALSPSVEDAPSMMISPRTAC